jgi:hypothetical protein
MVHDADVRIFGKRVDLIDVGVDIAGVVILVLGLFLVFAGFTQQGGGKVFMLVAGGALVLCGLGVLGWRGLGRKRDRDRPAIDG